MSKKVVKSRQTFFTKLASRWQDNTCVCVGLDPDYEKISALIKNTSLTESFFLFNKEIIDATADIVCAFKPNIAFYEAYGSSGWAALEQTTQYIKTNFPHIPIILDAKRADIGSTNRGYVRAAFEQLQVDAITLHPYLGKEALKPFLEREEKGIIILVKTSNPGSDEFQNLTITQTSEPLYHVVAKQVATLWNTNNNCAIVVGATYPNELKHIRSLVGDMPILIPGIGTQGGDLKQTVSAGKDSRGQGMIISSSRAILYASENKDFAQAARAQTEKLRQQINSFR